MAGSVACWCHRTPARSFSRRCRRASRRRLTPTAGQVRPAFVPRAGKMSLAGCHGEQTIEVESRKTRRDLNVNCLSHGGGWIRGHRLGWVFEHRENERTYGQQDCNAQPSHHGPHGRDRRVCVEKGLALSLVPAAFSRWQVGAIEKKMFHARVPHSGSEGRVDCCFREASCSCSTGPTRLLRSA